MSETCYQCEKEITGPVYTIGGLGPLCFSCADAVPPKRKRLTFGSAFAGIGGFDCGFARAGLICKWQVEIDSRCRRVLAKKFPDAKQRVDIRKFLSLSAPGERVDDYRVDVICGGFPCQDISVSGTGEGIDGERSGLWREFARVLGIIRPRYAVVENSPALTVRGLQRVLGDLATLRFDAEWSVLSACAMGAPHTRERMFIVAYPQSSEWRPFGPEGCDLEDEYNRLQVEWQKDPSRIGECPTSPRGQWAREPGMARVVDGLPHRLDRLRGLGNAVIPHIAYWIGMRILEHERNDKKANGGSLSLRS